MAETSHANAVNTDALNPGIGRDMNGPAADGDPRNPSLEVPGASVMMPEAKQDSHVVADRDVEKTSKSQDIPADTNHVKEGKLDEVVQPVSEPASGTVRDKIAESALDAKLDASPAQKPEPAVEKTEPMEGEGEGDGNANAKIEDTVDGKQDSTKEETNGPTGDESDEDPFADLDDVASMDIYDLSNYTFGKKNQESKSRVMQMLSKTEMADALRKNYDERGMRRSVGGVILVHSHNFPHVLLLQRSDGKGEYALPGGRLRPGESDEEGLSRKLNAKLKPSGQATEDEDQELDIGERSTISYPFIHTKAFVFDMRLLASHRLGFAFANRESYFLYTCFVSLMLVCNWYAIDFHRRYYPYIPAHVTKVKEEFHVYTVLLPNKFMFSVPKNLQLVAVPLFELFNNSSTYGDVISAIPSLLSRWHINYC